MSVATTAASRGIAAEQPRNQGAENQYVSFWVGDQLLGIPVQVVQEVLNPQTIAPTPLARAEVAGLLNLRGQIVTAFNLRHRLGISQPLDGKPFMNVVVRHKGESFSLLVDEVGDVIRLNEETIEPPPRTLESRWRSVTRGVSRLEDRLLVILDVGAVLNLN